jgi:putative hemolysin
MGERILSRTGTQQPYRVRLASTEEDLLSAQKLRFEIFNLELQEGLQESFDTGLDRDPFDTICDHLVVEEVQTKKVVGTYRLQTGKRAAANRGYYSAQEFDFSPLEPLRGEMVELGRACVDGRHRNLAVLGLLWKGIADYAKVNAARYLIGCSSLTSQDATVGAAAYEALKTRHLAEEHLRATPLPQCACPMEHPSTESPKIPRLLAAYLSVGAKICGPPAIDRDFKTIDFLTVMDLDTLPLATVQRYLS